MHVLVQLLRHTHFIRSRIDFTQMVIPKPFQLRQRVLAGEEQRTDPVRVAWIVFPLGDVVCVRCAVPHDLQKRLDFRWSDVTSLSRLERMPAQDPLAPQGRLFRGEQHEVDQGMSRRSVQPIHLLRAGQRHLRDVLRKLDPRSVVDLHQLVHASQRRLGLAGHKMRANSEAVNLVTFLVQRMDHLLVEVVARDDRRCSKLREAALFRGLAEELARLLAEVREVAGVQSNANRLLSKLDQLDGDGDEVRHAGRQRVVRVHQSQEAGREGLGVADESRKLPIVGTMKPELLARLEDGSGEVAVVPEAAVPQVINAAVRLHIRMCVGALDGDVRQLPGQHVAGGVKAPDVAVS
mmetsp:Transcript_2959/g.11985  ORF Transcript_2959/g.11985 Transcript_2959/m.11985 type:complete len:350 (-) Transcript_2959:677-1726(-)